MRQLLLAPLALLAFSPAAEELAYGPEEGASLSRTFTARGSYRLTEARLSVDGEELDGVHLPELSIESIETISVTDAFVTVGEDGPTAVERTFDELDREQVYSAPEQEDATRTFSSDLEGETVAFRWDDEEEDWVASSESGLDEGLLGELEFEMDFVGLLPDGEVEEGDSWEADAEVYAILMWPGGQLAFYDDEVEEIDETDLDMDLQARENLDGEATVTFAGTRDGDGETVAVLEVLFEVSTNASAEIDVDLGTMERTIEMTRTVEGEVLWSLARSLPASVELEATVALAMTSTGPAEGPDGEVELEDVRRFEGTIEYTASFEVDA